MAPGTVRPRSSEMLVEATYQAEIVPGWFAQPTVQYVHRPGAGAINPRDPKGGRIPDATILGLRSAIRY